MAKQVLVIGLGRFGMTLARALAASGVEVFAVDKSEERVRAAGHFAAEAARFDATDAEAMAQAAPSRRDAAICAIGDDEREASILCTALLRQMGAPRVIARSSEELHSRILKMVGAHEVVNPLEEFADRLAKQLAYEGLIGEMPLGQDLAISEIRPPQDWIGRTLAGLRLPQAHGITVVALRSEGGKTVELPAASRTLEAGDVLIVVSRRGAATKALGG